MHIRSRYTAWALVMLAALFILASAFFPAFACHHACIGDGCPVCLQINGWTSVLRLFGAGMGCVLLCLAGRSFIHNVGFAWADFLFIRTPIRLKTKLLI